MTGSLAESNSRVRGPIPQRAALVVEKSLVRVWKPKSLGKRGSDHLQEFLCFPGYWPDTMGKQRGRAQTRHCPPGHTAEVQGSRAQRGVGAVGDPKVQSFF